VPKPVPPAVIALLLATAIARADTRVAPGWPEADAASRRAEIDVVAAFTEDNTDRNFNGHHTGNVAVMVPLGWRVETAFATRRPRARTASS
jgi:hypothetical protein